MSEHRRGWRRWQVIVAVCLGGVLVVGAHVAYVLHAIRGAFETSAELSLDIAAHGVSDWYATRQAQASLLARLVAMTPVAINPESTLRAFVEEGRFERGEVRDSAGRVLASFAPLRPTEAAEAPALVAFTASPRIRGGRLRTVTLTAPLAERLISNLNPQADMNRTGRTTLIERRGDSAKILALGSGSVAPRQSFDAHSLPDFVRETTPGHPAFGVGTGLYGTRVIYATRALTGLPLLLVRERDVADVEQVVSGPLAINESVLLLVYALIVIVIDNRVRAGRQRRDAALARVRSDFVSSISHELRTPLTQIRMYAEMLNNGLLPHPAEAGRALQVIEKEAARLSVLVDKVLNFTRVREIADRANVPTIPIAAAVARATTSFTPLAADRDASIETAVSPGTTARVDPEALQQVLLNLLDNAVKYGPRGQTIHISAARVNGMTRLSVRDEGPGVPTAERDMIWEPFRRGQLAESSDEIGSGIGLSVVREIITQFGGSAYVGEPNGSNGSNGSNGACFVVELPAGDASASD